ncbi:flavodoxin domain-containing protein [Glaciimonas sp. CA11.2]|uniref:flavodoxin domain-containing protein n=1 Tax=unclassified Glaciimonas TaxID=2644401 RepID=UPI002AB3E903|nr:MULTISPECIES: flavodoxin domain-containing protein [unclassified Glaciimonas]MDY7549108.1 flavodoxin domain-containing protein [Glaciimonas sp. CA11.2]MEB0013100.1 flavodoxin domain-containing protein [Glaciimonas sp. Cout2]MEB0082017.1 flavodoxin domain-containing protein [Glaciimonas sp. Gout2]MEB0161845.1 flavodoxin domain-containing protein [Glaciimonas sp. CA11.2]
MSAIPLIPKNAPFSTEEISVLNKVVSRTTSLQRSWLAGFFAGFEAAQGAEAVPATTARPRASLTVLYATESGNAESLAIKAKKAAQKHGLDARVIDMADADMGLLAKTKNLIVYAATWGEGDPRQHHGRGASADRGDPLIVQYAKQRNEGERFGDFVIRAEFVTATLAGNRFHAEVVLTDY